MRLLVLHDAERACEISEDLIERLRALGQVERVDLRRGDLAWCVGCLKCWSGGTGVCVARDRMPELEARLEGAVAVVFLTAVVFGSFSAVIKNTVDKGFGANLCTEVHYPQLVVGFGADITPDEEQTFLDLTLEHRGPRDVVHPELAGVPVDAVVTRSVEDNPAIVQRLAAFLGMEGAI